jgi:hypothetical protein
MIYWIRRGQKTENREQRTEDSEQKTENRKRRTENSKPPQFAPLCHLSSVFCPLFSPFCLLSSILCLLSSVLCLAPSLRAEPSHTITIDGKFDDWASIPSHLDPAGNEHDTSHKGRDDIPAHVEHADVDLLEYKFTHDAENIYAYFRARGQIGRTRAGGFGRPAGRYYAIVAIDVDHDEETGYWLHGGGFYPTSGGYDINAEIEWYAGKMNATPYINHCCVTKGELDQAFLDQSSGEYKKGKDGPYRPGFVRLGAGTYQYYTEWVYHQNDTLTFVRDMCPRTLGIIEGALSADGHQLEMKIPMKGFLVDQHGKPLVALGRKINVSFSLEASGESAGDRKWASNTGEPIREYFLEPPNK